MAEPNVEIHCTVTTSERWPDHFLPARRVCRIVARGLGQAVEQFCEPHVRLGQVHHVEAPEPSGTLRYELAPDGEVDLARVRAFVDGMVFALAY